MTKDHDLLIIIAENVKCLPEMRQDMKRINGTLIETKTRLDIHEKNENLHSKIGVGNGDMGLTGKIIRKLLSILFKKWFGIF